MSRAHKTYIYITIKLNTHKSKCFKAKALAEAPLSKAQKLCYRISSGTRTAKSWLPFSCRLCFFGGLSSCFRQRLTMPARTSIRVPKALVVLALSQMHTPMIHAWCALWWGRSHQNQPYCNYVNLAFQRGFTWMCSVTSASINCSFLEKETVRHTLTRAPSTLSQLGQLRTACKLGGKNIQTSTATYLAARSETCWQAVVQIDLATNEQLSTGPRFCWVSVSVSVSHERFVMATTYNQPLAMQHNKTMSVQSLPCHILAHHLCPAEAPNGSCGQASPRLHKLLGGLQGGVDGVVARRHGAPNEFWAAFVGGSRPTSRGAWSHKKPKEWWQKNDGWSNACTFIESPQFKRITYLCLFVFLWKELVSMFYLATRGISALLFLGRSTLHWSI